MPHIEEWVEPLTVAPVLFLGILGMPDVPDVLRFQKVPHCSWWILGAPEGPRLLWRVLEWSGHNRTFLEVSGWIWWF